MQGRLGRLLRTTAIYGLGGALLRALGLILLPLFTAHLTPLDYGVNAMLAWVTFAVSPLFSLGFGAALAPIYFASRVDQRGTSVWTAATILFVSALSLIGVAFLFGDNLSTLVLGHRDYSYLTTLALVGAALSVAVTPFPLYLQFQERAKAYVLVSLLGALLTTGVSVWLVVHLGKGVEGLVEANVLGQAASFVMFSCVAARVLGRYTFDLNLAKQLWRLGLPLIPSFVFVFVLQDGNRYLLQWIAGARELGIYAVGVSVGMAMSLFVSAFQTAWLPYFMSYVQKRDEAASLFGRVMTYYVFAFGALTLLFFIAAKPLVVLLTQRPYYGAYKVVGLSAAAQFLFGAFNVLLPAIYFANHVRYVGLIQALAALLSVGLNLLLIPFFGFVGAAAALAFGVLCLVLLTYTWNRAHRSEYLVVKYEWRRLKAFAAVFVIYATTAMWERQLSLSIEILLSLVLAGVLLLVIYSLLVVEERKRIWSILRIFRGAMSRRRNGDSSERA